MVPLCNVYIQCFFLTQKRGNRNINQGSTAHQLFLFFLYFLLLRMNEILYPPGKEESYAKLFSPPIFFWDPIALNHRQVLNYPLSLYFCSIELQFDRQRGIFKPVFQIRIQMMRIRIHGSAFRNCGS